VTAPIRPDPQIVSPIERFDRGQSVGRASDSTFADLLGRVLSDTSALETGAQDLIAAFLRGEPVELHQVMAASEEASISLELLVEIRNKLTEAYRSVMNIQ
jgi:flagellar hook-basal body complex protein FliE